MAKKKKPRPDRKSRHPARRSLPPPLVDGLDEASSLRRRRRFAEARDLLESLEKRYPRRPEVLAALLDVYHQMGDMRGYVTTCEHYLALEPNHPELTAALAAAYMNNMRPFLGLRTFRRFLERWPDHPKAGEIRDIVTKMEPDIAELLADTGIGGDDAEEVAALHEQVQSLLTPETLSTARRKAEELHRRRPDFVPGLNNLGEILFRDGEPEQAVATARRVLELEPGNVHALANLTRYLFLSGHTAEANEAAARLRSATSQRPDSWVKKAEALTYLGDDQGVLDALRGFEQAGETDEPTATALLYHLAAVAAHRQGRPEEAQQLWKKSQELYPGFDLVQANLAELRRGIEERNAPWAYSLAYWIPEKMIREMETTVVAADRRRASDDAVVQSMKHFLTKHPELVALAPALLDRGDGSGREFIVRLGGLVKTPELIAALRDFALGTRGADRLRLQAAEFAAQTGAFPEGKVRLWLRGEWSEVLLLGFELHADVSGKHSPQVRTWLEEASEALNQGDGAAGEKLLRKALEVEPEALDTRTNLALARQLQGHTQEAEAIIREVHQHHPDYLFAATAVARFQIRDDKLAEARALLEPLLARRRLHYSEFAALCSAEIELLLAEKNEEGARAWMEMWERGDPEHPQLERYRRLLRKPAWGR